MSDRSALVRTLAEIDQLLAEAESIAVDPQDDDGDRALLIEFEGARKRIEAKLRGEHNN